MSRVRMAVIGVGALGRHHARILSELPEVQLVAVVDSHAERGQEVAEKCRTRWVSNYRHLLDRVDAVSIVVPTFAHLSVAGDFLRAGVPVLVEKPLAGHLGDAQQIAQLARQMGTLLQVGHVERFNPAMVAAKPHIEAPRYIRAERVSPYAFRSTDIGVVHDLMIHDIDLVHWLAGTSHVVHVEAMGVSVMGEHEDIAQARLHFANGCIADITANRVHPTASRKIEAYGLRGTVHIDMHARTVWRMSPSLELLQGESPLAKSREPGANIEQLKKDVFTKYLHPENLAVGEGDALTAELKQFVRCVQTGRQPLVGGEEGVVAMKTADMVLQSLQSHQWNGVLHGPVGPLPWQPKPQLRVAA